MMPEIPNPLFLLGIISLTGGILVIIAILYLKQKQNNRVPDGRTPVQKSGRLDYQPQARPVPAVPPKSIPRPVQKPGTLPQPKNTSILNGRSDITESLLALAEKYSLDQFTIATSDGLVFASSGGENAQTDAAQYSEIHSNDPLFETPGVVLSVIPFKGSDLILIIRTPLAVPDTIQQGIENDTKDILNWWI